MRVSGPITVSLPDYGVLFAESAHAAEFRMAERTDRFHKLIYVLSGRVAYREKRRDKVVEAGAGSMLVVPRDVTHEISDLAPSTLLLLCLEGHFLGGDSDLARLWNTFTRLPERRIVLSRPTRQRLEGMWRRAIVETQHARIGGPVTVRALAAQTLVLLARLPAEGGGASATERVAAVLREVDETFHDEWDVDRAAARAGLSRHRFTDLFRAEAGMTFWDYLNGRRLDHAAKLLRAGELSVTGVMFSCGFNDLSHFYRMFRQKHGLAPKKWAEQAAKA
jgi:AraC-like DNA-binding protein